ncbi:hypothetical protein BKA70DRAFT_1458885 [Coprinopsis sp. MPI-PUGE-AT-0042]|nr:hypothetical protein BKA70DRAFT_1458885 [Coprinopsis sp. MPI-PUGE-AT-0042]
MISRVAKPLPETALPEISEYESATYYFGVSPGYDHRRLLYRSDALERPFPRPEGRFPDVITKTAYTLVNTPLNKHWPAIDTQIRDIVVEKWVIRYASITLARFFTKSAERVSGGSFGPDVVWIGVLPRIVVNGNSLDSDDDAARKLVHGASLDILSLLKGKGLRDVTVEWFKGTPQRYHGLLRSVNRLDATHHVRRFLTATLGIPIAADARMEEDVTGTLGLLFHENRDSTGLKSDKVLGVTASHVVSKDEQVDYELGGAGAPCLKVRASGERRFQRGVNEINRTITGHELEAEADRDLLQSLTNSNEDPDPAQRTQDEERLARLRASLKLEEKAVAELQAFRHDIETRWGDLNTRCIGHVEWAPAITIDPTTQLTKDVATVELDAGMFQDAFSGNVVDLGAKYSIHRLKELFGPLTSKKKAFTYPRGGLLRIAGVLTSEELANLDQTRDECIMVGKVGSTTDLTVGRLCGMQSFLWPEGGKESRELAIYNSDSATFALPGDSGALVFDGQGQMAAFLHSGYEETKSHITFATPAWWVIEQLRTRYPHADFSRTNFK